MDLKESIDSREDWLLVFTPTLGRLTTSWSAQTADNLLLRLLLLGVKTFLGVGGVTLLGLPRPLGRAPVLGRTPARGTSSTASTTTWLSRESRWASIRLTLLLSLTNLPQFQALLASRTDMVPAMQDRVFNPKKVAPSAG